MIVHDYTQTASCCHVSFETGDLTAAQLKQAVSDLAALPAGRRVVWLKYLAYGYGTGGSDKSIELCQVADPMDWFVNGPRVERWARLTAKLYRAWYDGGVKPDLILLDHEHYFSPFRFTPDEFRTHFTAAKANPKVVLPAEVRAIDPADLNRYGDPRMKAAQQTFYMWQQRRDEQALSQVTCWPFEALWGHRPRAVNYDTAIWRDGFVTYDQYLAASRRIGDIDSPEQYIRMNDTRLASTTEYDRAAAYTIDRLINCTAKEVVPWYTPLGLIDTTLDESWTRFEMEEKLWTKVLSAAWERGVRECILWRPSPSTQADVDDFKALVAEVCK